MENKIADFYLQLKELKSGIIILQKAVENESEEIETTDIRNCLEIIKDKINNSINAFDEFVDDIKDKTS